MYTATTPINKFRSDITVDMLKGAVLRLSPKSPLGTQSVVEAFDRTAKNNSIDQIYLLAHAVLESAWGTSRIAIDKNNIFGYKAYDRDPYNSAEKFATKEKCIEFVGKFIADQYLNPKGKWYGGSPTLRGMNVRYATATHWADSIAKLCSLIESNAKPAPATPNPSSPLNATPNHRTVEVMANLGVNLRNSPDSSNNKNVVKALPKGTKVIVDSYVEGTNVSGNSLWWKIKDNSLYLWSGGTNIIPTPTKAEGVGSTTPVTELTKSELEKKVESLKDELSKVVNHSNDKDNVIKNLEKELSDTKSKNIDLEAQVGNQLALKKGNEVLVDQIEAYKIKLTEYKLQRDNAYAEAFKGWELTAFPEGKKSLGHITNAAVKILHSIKSSEHEPFVIAMKKGATLHTVEKPLT